jgi:hypothetical protein
MDLGENLSNSFEYAKNLFSDVGRLIILIIVPIIPIIGWFIVLGYEARVLKESPGTGVPPKLERYGDLIVGGARVFFAALIYLLIPIVLIGIGSFSAVAGLVSLQGPAVAAGIMLGGTGFILVVAGIILGILLSIILCAGMAHMIKTGKFGKAFAFGEIFGIVRGIGWTKYLTWVIILIVIDAVVFGIGRIPYVGLIILAVIDPVVGVFISRSMGLLYNDGAPAELRVQPPVVGAALACASCGTQLQSHHKFCPSCGAAAPAPPPPTAQSDAKFCISCGAKIPATATFCGSCGAKQT